MKNEIKELYKKDKKLAIQVAKVLGFKIKASTPPEVKKASKLIKKIEKMITTSLQDIYKEYQNAYKSLKIEIPSDIESSFRNIDKLLTKFKYDVGNNILELIAKQIVDKVTKKNKKE